MQDGWEARRVTGASHSHAFLYYAFLRFFFPLPSSLVVLPRTFRFSSSSSSDLANARPSFPFPSYPLILLMNLAACAVVNISPRQVDRRGSNLLCDSLHIRARSFAASRQERSPRPQNEELLRSGMLSRENCVYSWMSAGGIEKEKNGRQETVVSLQAFDDLDFRVSETNSVGEVQSLLNMYFLTKCQVECVTNSVD